MSYVITELSPSPTNIDIKRMGNFLEVRTPILMVGEYQGGDRELPDGTVIAQRKIYYSPEMLQVLAKTALGVNGDVEHSDSKFDVVSVLRETDLTDPNVLYGRIIVHNQKMINEILAGNFRGISIQARMDTKFNKETNRFDATGGEILAYGHTDNPAVSTATIESMKTIQLSHNIIETFNKNKKETNNHKTKSELSMTNEDKVVELSAQLAEKSVLLSERDTKVEELSSNLAEQVAISEQHVATATDQEAKLVEIAKKHSELETAIQLGKQEAQEKELVVLQAEITKIDEKFDAKTYLHETMNFESKKQLLMAILADKKKLSQGVSLAGLPNSTEVELSEEALKKELGGTDLATALGGQRGGLFW